MMLGTDDDLGFDPHRDKPRKASRREVGYALNRIALALGAAHDELAKLRHELQVVERLDVQRRKVSAETGR